jgi:type IV secretory pathway TrbD component
MIVELIGAQLLNISSVVAARLTRTPSHNRPAIPRNLDCLLILGGTIAALAAIYSFLHIFAWFGLVFWLLSCLAFVMGIWSLEDGVRSLLGVASLIGGVALLLVEHLHGA